ncbi:MAG: acyl-CoA reductase [Limisphaerales bacterium]
MELPNYFLADLPPEAEMTPALVHEACGTLRRNRERYLLPRPTAAIVDTLDALAREWRRPGYRFREVALERGPEATGFSRATIESGLDAFFSVITARNLQALVSQDLGHLQRLDQLVSSEAEQFLGLAAHARGPGLVGHIAGGVLPSPLFTGLILGLLARSAQFVKCPAGGAFLPRLLAHSLHEVEPKLAACLELASWRGGTNSLDDSLLAAVDALTVTGTDAAVTAIRARAPARVRVLAYGHQVSLGYAARESLTPSHAPALAARFAHDVADWDQLGCLSPHAIYCETGGALTPEQFAAELASALAAVELDRPRGPLSPEHAADIVRRREVYEIRAAYSEDTRCWFSEGSTSWSVVLENDPQWQASCLHRFVYVKAVDRPEACLRALAPLAGRVSTVALAAAGSRARDLAGEFARWGVTRICPPGRMQHPPLTWRHDGRPSLGDLVTWTSQEMPS